MINTKDTNLTFDQAYLARVDGLVQESDTYSNLLTNLSSSKQTTTLAIKANNKDLKLNAELDVQASANSKTLQWSSLITYDASFADNTTSQQFESTGSVVVDNIWQNVYATVKSFNLTSSDAAFINALVRTYIDKPIILPITQDASGSLQAQQIVSEFAKLPAIIRESLLKNPIFKPVWTKSTTNGKSVYQIQVDQTWMKKVIESLTNNPTIQQAFNISPTDISFEDLSQAFSWASFIGELVIRDSNDVALSIQSIESVDKSILVKANLYAFDGFISITEQTLESSQAQTIQIEWSISPFWKISIQWISYTDNNAQNPEIKWDVEISVSVSDDSFASEGVWQITFPLPTTSSSSNPEPLTVQFDRSSTSTKAENLIFVEPINPIKFEDLFGGMDGSNASDWFDSIGINQPWLDITTPSPTVEELGIGNPNP